MIQTIDFRWRDVPIPYRCDGCPYPRVGFICRNRVGNCTRTDVEQLTERQRRMRELGIPCSPSKRTAAIPG